MNGTDIKKAAINKAKQVAQAANGNGGKKRRKGQDLKPIITTEKQGSQDASPASTGSFHYKYVAACTHARCRQCLGLDLFCPGSVGPWLTCCRSQRARY